MVTRNQSASQSGGREPSQQHKTNGEAAMVDEFVIKLAQALRRRGKRTWKVNFSHAKMSNLKKKKKTDFICLAPVSSIFFTSSFICHAGKRGI